MQEKEKRCFFRQRCNLHLHIYMHLIIQPPKIKKQKNKRVWRSIIKIQQREKKKTKWPFPQWSTLAVSLSTHDNHHLPSKTCRWGMSSWNAARPAIFRCTRHETHADMAAPLCPSRPSSSRGRRRTQLLPWRCIACSLLMMMPCLAPRK